MTQPPTGVEGPLRPPPPVETTAVLALVLASVFAPLGIVSGVVSGVVARRSTRLNGTQGYELATAGLWMGVVTAMLALLLVALFAVPLTSLLVLLALIGSTAP